MRNERLINKGENTNCKTMVILIFPLKFKGKGQNYEFHNVENQKEHRKKFKGSEHRKDLLKGSECRKRKRSEHRK